MQLATCSEFAGLVAAFAFEVFIEDYWFVAELAYDVCGFFCDGFVVGKDFGADVCGLFWGFEPGFGLFDAVFF